MRAADEIQQVTPSLWHWQAYDPTVKTDLSCCAIATGGGLYFVDPIPLADEPLEELAARTRPAGVILTSANHERAAASYGRRFGIPLFAHADARADIDAAIEEGSRIGDALRVMQIPGAADGEIALHSDADGGLLVLGDALINVEPLGFALLPEKYCADAALLPEGLRRLLDLKFRVMAFAHGTPIVSAAHERLSALLATSASRGRGGHIPR